MRLRLADGTLLPLTISGQAAAKLMGSPVSSTYELLADDQFPTPVIRTARRKVRVVTQPLLDALGVRYEAVPDDDDAETLDPAVKA